MYMLIDCGKYSVWQYRQTAGKKGRQEINWAFAFRTPPERGDRYTLGTVYERFKTRDQAEAAAKALIGTLH
jgi:hypothetical protein